MQLNGYENSGRVEERGQCRVSTNSERSSIRTKMQEPATIRGVDIGPPILIQSSRRLGRDLGCGQAAFRIPGAPQRLTSTRAPAYDFRRQTGNLLLGRLPSGMPLSDKPRRRRRTGAISVEMMPR